MENIDTNTHATRTVKADQYGRCHKCEVAKIAERMRRGENIDEGTANAARTACEKCKCGTKEITKSRCGLNLVQLDVKTMVDPQGFIARFIDKDYAAMLKTERANVTALDETAERIALELIEAFRGLTFMQLRILHGLLSGKNLAGIAKEIGISRQAIHKHAKQIPNTRAIAAFIRALIGTTSGHDALKKARMFARE